MLFIGEDNLIRWDALTDSATGAYVNDATVAAQLKDSANTSVGGSVTLSYVSASNGRYQGTLDDSVAAGLTKDGNYWLEVTATASGGRKGFRRIPFKAGYHGAD